MSIFKKVGSFFLDLVETIVIALALFVIMYLFLFQPHQVKGNSMYANFHDGEYLLTDKVSYHLSQPKRGEVVIFKAPQNQEFDYIKRIIGLPEEKLRIQNGAVFIDEKKLEEPYLPEATWTRGGKFLPEGKTIIIPQGQYFVMGDNRGHSSDSRDWGPVPREGIIGKAWLRYWPLKEIGLIPKAEYLAI